VLSLAIAMVLYLLAATVLTGMVDYRHLSDSAAFSAAFESVGLSQFAKVVAVGAIVGIFTVLFSFTLGASRIWYAISRDGLLPGWFAETNAHHSPHRPVWIVGLVSAGIAGFVKSDGWILGSSA
jgi:basic amino acid/polyamine antiporter, APA family